MPIAKELRFILSCLFLLSFESNAETALGLSTNFQYFDYEEYDLNNISLNHEKGILPGLQGFLKTSTHKITHTFMASIHAADVDYDGQLQNGSPHKTKTNTTLFNLGYRLSYPVYLDDIFIHSQLNWDHWNRSIRATTFISGLDEAYSWPSIDLGFSYIPIRTNKHKLIIEAAYTKIFEGNFEVDLSDLGYGIQELNLGDGNGYQSQISYQYTLNKKTYASLNLLYKTWSFARSDIKTISNGSNTISFLEPRSESKRIGLSFMLIFIL